MSADGAGEISAGRASTSGLKNVIIIAAVVVIVGVAAYVRSNRPASGGPVPDSAAGAGLPRMVDLGSDKCAACKEMIPILAELKKELAGKAVIDFIDVWKEEKAAAPFAVRVIPTQVFFDTAGKEVWRHEGFLEKAEILAKLKELGAKDAR
ncbi:MAG: thioredoxin family protein [Phycisphaerales bacterium]|nr:thioredoxin family protein [Phycisphaerales bacterium]